MKLEERIEKRFVEKCEAVGYLSSEIKYGINDKQLKEVAISLATELKKDYVRLDEIEIEEEKVERVLRNVLPNKCLIASKPEHINKWIETIKVAIAEAKPVKVKEK